MFAVWYCVLLPISVPACAHQMWWCVQTSQQVPNHFVYCLTTQDLMKNLVNFRKGEKLFQFPVQIDFDVSLPLPSFLGISLHSSHLSRWAWILVIHHSFPVCPGCCGRLGSLALPLRGTFPQLNTEDGSSMPGSEEAISTKLWMQVCLRRGLLIARGGCPPLLDLMKKLFLGPLPNLSRAERARSAQAV